jgi:serine/threonine-protein kinase RsbT
MVIVSSETSVAIEHEADVVKARQKGRELAAELGFSSTEQTLIATAISEIARNIVTYAGRGSIAFSRIERQGRAGILIVATDQGPGIADKALAMRDGYSTGNSLGVGLPGARRLVDELELESAIGVGTTVTLRKWLQ